MEKQKVKIGILAIQGAFSEHNNAFFQAAQVLDITIDLVEIRCIKDITNDLDGIVLPGGESTAMGFMLNKDGFGDRLKSFISGQLNSAPIVWGTCSGLIMLANNVENEKKGGQYVIGGLDVTVSRNFFGRQVNSFEAPVILDNNVFPEKTCHGVFIRAPAVISYDKDNVKVLGTVESLGNNTATKEVVVAVEQGNLLATSFHPELTSDIMWQKHFIKMILAKKAEKSN